MSAEGSAEEVTKGAEKNAAKEEGTTVDKAEDGGKEEAATAKVEGAEATGGGGGGGGGGGDDDQDHDDVDPLVIDENKGAEEEKKQEEENEGKKEEEASTAAALEGSSKEEEDEEEKEFEPTIDMMMNDFDDERTLEEEEALEGEAEENTAAEVGALEQEADMPLEDLLKMYYGGGSAAAAGEGAKDEDELEVDEARKKDDDGAEGDGEDNVEDESAAGEGARMQRKGKRPSLLADKREADKNREEGVAKSSKPTLMPKPGEKRSMLDESGEEKHQGAGSMSPPPPAKKSKSELARFYEAAVEGRALRSSAAAGGGGGGGGPEEEEDESEPEAGGESSDHEGARDYSWKKTIMIGPSYQASVPSGMAEYDGDALPYENEDKLLWDPKLLKFGEVEGYLSKSQESLQKAASGVASLPQGLHIRDDEQALHMLLQCGYNYEEALRRRGMNAVPPAETMTLWSEEECRAFELGLRLYGKDFHMIQQQKVRTRSVGELVQFYYLWKKTERHDVFATATRLEKKKYTLHPGTTDYMDRFIEEQDPSRDRSSSPNYHSLLYGADAKKSQSPTLNLSRPGEHQSATNGDSAAVDSATPVGNSNNGAAGDTEGATATESSMTPVSSGASTAQ